MRTGHGNVLNVIELLKYLDKFMFSHSHPLTTQHIFHSDIGTIYT